MFYIQITGINDVSFYLILFLPSPRGLTPSEMKIYLPSSYVVFTGLPLLLNSGFLWTSFSQGKFLLSPLRTDTRYSTGLPVTQTLPPSRPSVSGTRSDPKPESKSHFALGVPSKSFSSLSHTVYLVRRHDLCFSLSPSSHSLLR